MKKILFITPFTPSNKDAGANYTKQLLENLSQNNQIDLIYFRYKFDELYNAPNPNVKIVRYINNSLLYKLVNIILFPLLFPLFTVRFNWMLLYQLKSLIKKETYDYIYFDFSQTFLYAYFIKHPRKILMSHDVITQRFEREKSYVIYWISFSEKFLLKQRDIKIFTFSKKDTDLISKYFQVESDVTNFFLPKDIINLTINKVNDYFVLFAMWKRPDNYKSIEWLIKYIFPIIKSKVIIIGGGMPEHIKNQLQNYSNIEYLGFIENPYPIIAQSKALLAPIFNGAGVKVKVIESLACGTPVIGTNIAFEGIGKEYSEFMISANTAEEFKKSIKDINVNLKQKENYRNYFLNNYTDYPIIRYINEKQ
ncbi:MAG: glycosyltransferase family 4 protein [Bacteroidaceae bacterium]|nr:glycosyltransferase family 4 protein [Bacteroidaceae bacterium]